MRDSWIDALPDDEKAEFAADVARASQASAEVGEWSVLIRTVREWRITAAIHADRVLAARLTGPLDRDFGPVPPPPPG